MITKSRDVYYCNVDDSKIHNAHPSYDSKMLKLLHYYIHERYSIHIKKDVLHLPSPWTDDSILSRLRFTQIRREHDRCSKWLINHISNNESFSLSDRIYNTLLYRMYNVDTTGELLHLPIEFTEGWIDRCTSLLDSVTNVLYYTNAYKTIGFRIHNCKKYNLDYSSQSQYVPLYIVRDLMQNRIADKLLSCTAQLDVYNLLQHSIFGCGSFLAYQFYVDLTYMNEFPFSENEFVISGPGCSYGLHMLITDSDGLSDAELLFWIRDNLASIFNQNHLYYNPNELFYDLPEYDRCINIMSLENIFCEFSKYQVRRHYTHKKMRAYRPRNNSNESEDKMNESKESQ